MAEPTKFRTLRQFVDSYPRAITQNQIAEVLGITPDRLSGYLSGRSRPSSAEALRISREHDIDLEGLLDPSSQDEPGSGSEQPDRVSA